MNDLGLSGKKMAKLVKNVNAISGLEQMLSVEVKNQLPVMHTFYKVKGRVIEVDSIKDYNPDEIEQETVELNEKKTKLAESELEFKELLELRLQMQGIKVDDVSTRKTSIKFFINTIKKAKNEYQKIIEKKQLEVDIHLMHIFKCFIFFLKNVETQQGKKIHPGTNPNDWGESTYALFIYLFDNYYTGEKPTKRKLTNIWFFLKGLGNDYPFYMTKDRYKEFIRINYNIEIKNFDKAFNYVNKAYPKMKEHRIVYSDSIK